MRSLTQDRRPALTAAALATAAAVFVGAAGLVAGGGGTARAAGGAVVIEEGEIDFAPRQVDGKLELQIDDRGGTGTVVREPSEVVLHVPQAALQDTASPVGEALGMGPVGTAWALNNVWTDAEFFAPEPGWNGTEAGGDAQVELSGYEGPGDFGIATYTRDMDNRNEAAVAHLASADGAPKSFTLPATAQHLLPIWQFTAQGVYRLTLTVSGEGGTDTETLAVVVGDSVDPADVLPGDGTAPTTPPPVTPSNTPSSPTAPPRKGDAVVLDDGHLDFAPRPVGGGLQFQVGKAVGQEHQWYEPGRLVLHVKPGARRKIPAGYGFLGTQGDAVWWLPQSQIAGLLWPGWGVPDFDDSDLDGPITARLDAVQGPGSVAMFNTASLGGTPTPVFNSGDGLPDTHLLYAHGHGHWNWTFTKEGVYRTTFTLSATLADGTKVSDTETLAWVVGDDIDPGTVKPGAGDGATATPTATPTAAPSESPSGTASASPSACLSVSASGAPTASVGSSSASSAGNSLESNGGSSGTGALASTGARVALVGGAAVLALLTGGVAVLAARRRRTSR
ncbi:choice-of-anchor M domain-containing protein [Streptomyces antnestii]|uniref:choice-of-anchor M domain-containing protein n=1 Tax=Streptomyces antnestii TaxID=2494256 RepID=UPI001678EEBB|nr:choice-of-anchor M domain-containing protein [Streptomyces sp. San01]